LFVAAIISTVGCQASLNSNQPETILTNFLDSVKEMDAQKAASFVVDRRYSDKEKQLKKYEESFQHLKLLNYKIKNIEKLENEKVYIDTILTVEQSGKTKEMEHTYRLIRVDGQWKVAFPSDESIEHLFEHRD